MSDIDSPYRSAARLDSLFLSQGGLPISYRAMYDLAHQYFSIGKLWAFATAMNEVFEIIIRALLEFLFELALKGPGYLIARFFYPPQEIAPDGCLVVILGIGFWTTIGLAIWCMVWLL